MATKPTAAPKARSAPEGEFVPRLVHAYRRLPYMVPGPNGVGEVEKAVEVAFEGEKVSFKTNEAGHVVGLVKNAGTFKRLIKEIPEAYIEYLGGDNVPEPTRPSDKSPQKPAGEFVLSNGDEFVVLDDMEDAEVREFAAAQGLEALPEVLEGEDLQRAVFNQLTTA